MKPYSRHFTKKILQFIIIISLFILQACGGSSDNPPADQDPVASFTAIPFAGNTPLEVIFDASASSDSDGNIVTYFWDFGDGETSAIMNPTHTYNAEGIFVAILTVTDDDGDTDTAFQTISVVTGANIAPTASFTATPVSGTAPLVVNLDASGSDDTDGSISSYHWDFGDGDSGLGSTTSHTYILAGSYTITLTVADNQTATDTATTTITVSAPSNIAPTAAFTTSASSGAAPLPVDFDATTSSDSDGTIASYSWDFGDSSTGTGSTISHTFISDGSYSVSLTVTDNGGATDTTTQTIAVSSSGTPIDSAGGIVTSADGNVSLFIPEDALTNQVFISITPRINYPSGAVVDTVYDLQPDGLVFNIPVQLTTFYNPTSNLPVGFDETTLRAVKITGTSLLAWQQLLDFTVDAGANSVTSSLSSFSSYGILSGDAFSDIATTVYVVDSIPGGSNVHFTDLAAAMSYLSSNLNAWESGKVLIQTSNTLTVSSLNFTHNISLEIDTGYTANIAGPGIEPLLVTASGSLGLSGLTISNAGGMMVSASSDVIMSNFNFPATTINIGAGGTKSLKAPVHPKILQRNGGGVSGNTWSIDSGFLDGPLTMGIGSQLSGTIDLSNITAPEIQLVSTSSASAQIAVSTNIVDDIGISMELGFGAGLTVENHANLNNLNMDLNLLDATTMDLRVNHALNTSLNIDGESVLTFNGQLNNYGNSNWYIGTGHEITLNLDDEEFESLTATYLSGDISINHNSLLVKSNLNISTQTGTGLDLNMLGTIDLQGDAVFNLNGRFTWLLNDTTTIAGFVSATAAGNIMDIKTAGANFQSGIVLDAGAVTGTLFVGVGGGNPATIQDIIDITVPAAGQHQVQFLGTTVMGVINISIPDGSKTASKNKTTREFTAPGIEIKNLTMTDSSEGHSGILITDVNQGSIVIEDVTMSGDGGIGLYSNSANTTISKATLNGQGISVTNNPGTVTINSGSSITVTSPGGGGITGIMSGDISFDGGTISAPSNDPESYALYAILNQKITVNGSTISGRMLSAPPGGVIGLTNNTFSGASIEDAHAFGSGGFINDPMDDGNNGMNPDIDIDSLIDWDGNSCADYPPDHNVKDGDGNCNVDGISPAS